MEWPWRCHATVQTSASRASGLGLWLWLHVHGLFCVVLDHKKLRRPNHRRMVSFIFDMALNEVGNFWLQLCCSSPFFLSGAALLLFAGWLLFWLLNHVCHFQGSFFAKPFFYFAFGLTSYAWLFLHGTVSGVGLLWLGSSLVRSVATFVWFRK